MVFYLSQAIPSLSRSSFLFALYNELDENGLYFVFPPLFLTFADFATPPLYDLFSAVQFLNVFGAASTFEYMPNVKVNSIITEKRMVTIFFKTITLLFIHNFFYNEIFQLCK